MYHINPATGRVNTCRATNGGCPFATPDEHFNSKEEARAHYETTQTPEEPLSKKPIVKQSGSSGEHNLYRGISTTKWPEEGEHCDLSYFSERDADQILDAWERPSRTNEVDYPLPEAIAINYYQISGYKLLGDALRTGAALGPKETEHVVNLNAALERGKLQKPLTLFRGIKGAYASELAKLRPGAVIEEESFSSTTPSEKGALTFIGQQGVMLQIEAPAGTKAIDLGAGIFSIDEDEILIREHKLKIEKVSRELLDGKPITRLVVRPA